MRRFQIRNGRIAHNNRGVAVLGLTSRSIMHACGLLLLIESPRSGVRHALSFGL
jgi:hypothetical protein